MLKTHEKILREFSGVGKRSKVILFGSVARGNYRLDSDIDIAVISSDKSIRKASSKIADDVLVKYGKVVSIKYFTEEEFSKRKRQNDSFVEEVLKGRVIYDGG